MQNLKQRIAALEVETAPTEPLTIIRRFVAAGKPQTALEGLRDEQGTEWRRESDESEQGLMDRASVECARDARGVALLLTW
jgi:hypothetical protein